MLSDGQNFYAYGMLAIQLNHLISENKLETFTIVKILKFIVNRIYKKDGNQKIILILLDLEPLVPGKEVISSFSCN